MVQARGFSLVIFGIASLQASLLSLGCGAGGSAATHIQTQVQSAHSVNLSWVASTSANVSGYNVYRAVYAGSCGHFSKINLVLNPGSAYTDSQVTPGASYCYATTAVNSIGEESEYSNILVNIQIPSP